MARRITCDRCGSETSKDYASFEVAWLPPDADSTQKPLTIFLYCGDGGDLCKSCAEAAARAIADQIREAE